jgi:hypothetical protein
MTNRTIAAAVTSALLSLLPVATGCRPFEGNADRAETTSRTADAAPTAEAHPSLLYGQVTNLGGASYEGPLRFGGDEESFWGDYFNGVKKENLWVAHVPPERLPAQRGGIELLGIRIRGDGKRADLARPFMARFGDIARIEAHGTDVRVILKSGAAAELNRFDASDFDDGVRVWDAKHGVVDLDTHLIRTIELLPSPRSGAAPDRLHGTVRTRRGHFTGFIQFDRQASHGGDALHGLTPGGEVALRFDTIRSIARDSNDSSRVTLRDGREIAISGTRKVGDGSRGMYVDDPRYGRVLISWDGFDRVEFSPAAGSGPTYADFPPGQALTGTVTTRDGRRLAGRLVYDLDESETTETLDAPFDGVDYTIPFGLIATLVPGGSEGSGRASLILHSGEALQLEHAGDLGETNGGVLIFTAGRERAEYVPWAGVARINFDRPSAMYPPS